MAVSLEWMDANPTQAAELLAPIWLNTDGDNHDDRGELLRDMIKDSKVYKSGNNGYWWGWSGYWWGWSGYWQEQGDGAQDGFWQNMSWQTVDTSKAKTQMKRDITSATSVPEPASTLGLLGLGWMGLASLYQRKGKDRTGR